VLDPADRAQPGVAGDDERVDLRAAPVLVGLRLPLRYEEFICHRDLVGNVYMYLLAVLRQDDASDSHAEVRVRPGALPEELRDSMSSELFTPQHWLLCHMGLY